MLHDRFCDWVCAGLFTDAGQPVGNPAGQCGIGVGAGHHDRLVTTAIYRWRQIPSARTIEEPIVSLGFRRQRADSDGDHDGLHESGSRGRRPRHDDVDTGTVVVARAQPDAALACWVADWLTRVGE